MEKNNINFAFFGTSRFSVIVLDELKKNGFLPSLIITTEDKPKGRKLILTPPEVKDWTLKENIPFIQPKTLKDSSVEKMIGETIKNPDVFIVASYGKIIPEDILNIPKHKTLNVHPSLLPKLRGASPIQSSILEENETGVTIIKLDKEMDHGPIVSQQKIKIENWPPYAMDLENILAEKGGQMLSEILPKWISDEIKETPQQDEEATFCRKIQKQDGEISLDGDPDLNLRKIRAYHLWPGAFTFFKHKEKTIRLVIKTAHIEEGKLILDRVVPEGKREMNFKEFERGLH
ncbi:MAG: methionyl-tRNA formyltransferase [Candidatus Paceibacterota bacterium]